MTGFEKHQHSLQDVFVNDVVFDVIGVMFHTEGEQLYYKTK